MKDNDEIEECDGSLEWLIIKLILICTSATWLSNFPESSERDDKMSADVLLSNRSSMHIPRVSDILASLDSGREEAPESMF